MQQNEAKLFHYGINLESRVRSNHPLRRIKESVDFGFVRPAVAHLYGRDGHESVDPIVIMKLMLLLFLDDISSERELMRMVPERLDYLWFLNFDLDDEVPDHSVLSKARKRWGAEVFEQLFIRMVGQCVEAGLVNGSKLHMDGSLVEADASKESIRSGSPQLLAQLKQVYEQEIGKFEAGAESKPRSRAKRVSSDDVDHPNDTDGQRCLLLPDSVGTATAPSVEASAAGQAPALEVVGREAAATGAQRQEAAPRLSGLMSETDPDAAIVRKGAEAARARYKSHRGVDDQCGVITAVVTTTGSVAEDELMMTLIDHHEANTGMAVRISVGDAQYGTNENFAECEKRGIQSHMGDLRATQSNSVSTRGIFKESEFQYDAEKKVYVCPAGERLKPAKSLDRNYEVYRSSARICAQCGLRTQCMKSKHKRRTIKRHIAYERIQRARQQSHSATAKRDRRRRKHLMEGSFADAANNHGFKRARWRGLKKQRIQDLLIATVQNIRILITVERNREAAAMAIRGNEIRGMWFQAAERGVRALRELLGGAGRTLHTSVSAPQRLPCAQMRNHR